TGIPNVTPATGNHLVVKVSSTMIETPNTGDAAPTGAGIIDPYTAGSDIPGVDARVNRYVGIYEVDSEGKVVKFSLIVLESKDINNGAAVPEFEPTPVPRPGTEPGTTGIPNVTPATGNHLVVKVSSTMIETPNTGDAVPTGTGIIDPYTAGSDIPGVDAKVNRYVGIYEVDSEGKVVKFSLIVITDKDVKSGSGDLNNDKNNLSIGYQEGDNAEHVTKTLYLPAKGESGHTTVTWTSSHPEVVKPNGRVNRAGAYDTDVYVTLTATITDDLTGAQTTRTFIVKVIRMSDEDAVREAAKDLSAEKAFAFTEGDTWESVTSQFTLLGQGLYGTNITWTSLDTGTIGVSLENGKAYGSVNRPQNSDKNVLLTAVIRKGNASITKTFLMVVKNKTVGKEADQTRQPTGRQAEASVNPSGTSSRDEFMILRTTLSNGSRIDTVIIDPSKVEGLTDAINPSEKDESKRTIAIQLQHALVDKADEFAIEIPSLAVAAIADRNALLEIRTDEGSIKLSAAALKDSADRGTDLYFRLVPIKDAQEQNEAKNALTSNSLVNQSAGGKSIQILSIPRKIETNFSGFATKVVIPLYGITIPEQNKQAFLDALKVFVEHTDGTTELLSGVVQYENGQPVGLEIQINRFSRFQFVNFTSNETSNGSPSGGSGGGGTVKLNDFAPSPSLNPGGTAGTTSVMADHIGKGNHLVVKVSSSTITAPRIGDAAPTGAGVLDPYVAGSDIKGADAEVNKYIAVYEVDSNNRIVKFMLLIVKKGDIKAVNGLIDLYINGVIQKDTAKLEVRGTANKDVTTIVVDNEAIIQKLQAEKAESTLTVPPVSVTNNVEVEINGQLLKLMYEKSNVLRFETENATYILPVTAIHLKGLLDSLGSPSDMDNVKFRLAISIADATTAAQMKEQVKNGQADMLITPVKFEVAGSYNGKVVNVDVFNRYITRLIKLSSGINPDNVTTGVYIRENGQMAHIPTMIESINGVPYAKIQSLYNGIFTLVNHPLKFKDVESHWAKAEVNDLASRLVIFGTDKEHFTSARDITRAEFAAIVVRALGLKHGDSKGNPFSDVKDTAWYAESIQIAHEFGIIDGYNGGEFGPMDPITREQAMTMIARAMTITGLKVEFKEGEVDTLLATFKDSSQSSAWAKESIAASVKAGIVTGKSDTTVAPKDAITRAEVAKIVAKLLQKSSLI
ncbi:immunoglobulin-like domain-containing protein, partial [Paenibacillus sp. NPDC057934]|uniref:immunoglobulin-like domain-containing protein n=1 Tax=Paenibacillus sp. NPDC057934 TaxID=3346282 RepID=UPI0036D7CF85